MALFDDAPNIFGRGSTAALPGFQEVLTAFLDLNVAQVATLAGAAMWLVLLALPLTGIDRRDKVAAATYAGFLLAAGTALLVAIPHWRTTSGYSGGISTPLAQVWAALAMILVAAYRWRGRQREDLSLLTSEHVEGATPPRRRSTQKEDVYE
jgi:hypothetical protein